MSVGRIHQRQPAERLLALAFGASALALAIIASDQPLWMVAIASFIFGLGNGLISPLQKSLLTRRTQASLRGTLLRTFEAAQMNSANCSLYQRSWEQANLQQLSRIVIAASGTSRHAGIAGKPGRWACSSSPHAVGQDTHHRHTPEHSGDARHQARHRHAAPFRAGMASGMDGATRQHSALPARRRSSSRRTATSSIRH